MASFASKSLFLLSALLAKDTVIGIYANANVDSAEKADPFDLAWNSYSNDMRRDDLMDLYECHANNHVKAFDHTLDVPPYSMVPTDETWELFEEAYYFAVGMEAPLEKQKGPLRGMKVPFEIRYDSEVGRGVFATEFVAKGTKVWSGDHTAGFQSIEEDGILKYPTYRRFIEYLNDHRTEKYNWACDAFLWAFHNSYGDGDNAHLCIALDHGSLFNNAQGGVQDETGTADATLDDHKIPLSYDKSVPFGVEGYPRGNSTENFSSTKKMNLPILGCHRDVVEAARDIQPGEELRYHYTYEELLTNGFVANDEYDDDAYQYVFVDDDDGVEFSKEL